MIQITSKPRLCQRNAFNDSRAASNNTLHSKTHRESLDAKEHRIIVHSHLLETISMKPRGWIDDMIQPGGYTYEYTLSCMNTTPQHTMKQKHTNRMLYTAFKITNKKCYTSSAKKKRTCLSRSTNTIANSKRERKAKRFCSFLFLVSSNLKEGEGNRREAL